MTARAAAVGLAWLAGLMLGVGLAKSEWTMAFSGGLLTLVAVAYFRKFAVKEPVE